MIERYLRIYGNGERSVYCYNHSTGAKWWEDVDGKWQMAASYSLEEIQSLARHQPDRCKHMSHPGLAVSDGL